MNIIVTDAGFGADYWQGGWHPWTGARPPSGIGLDIPNTLAAENLLPVLGDLPMIRIPFPRFDDGRGFSLARNLRLLGYTGRLRAQGHLLADQYTMLRRCGFDEVEIDQSLAQRQPLEDWKFRANWRDHDYQNRLRKAN
jgi:uncharacterized protein (DUF934 family)